MIGIYKMWFTASICFCSLVKRKTQASATPHCAHQYCYRQLNANEVKQGGFLIMVLKKIKSS